MLEQKRVLTVRRILALYDIIDVFLRVPFVRFYERFDHVLLVIRYNERVESALVPSDILDAGNCELEPEFLSKAESECDWTRNEIFFISELALTGVVLTWEFLDVLFLDHITFFIDRYLDTIIGFGLLVLDQFLFGFPLLLSIIELSCMVFALPVRTVFRFIVVIGF